MATVHRDPGLKSYSDVMERNDMCRGLAQEKRDFLIPDQAVGGVLVVGEDGVNPDIDIEHHEIVRLNDSLVTADAHNYTSISPSQKQPDEFMGPNTQTMRQECDDCAFDDSGCTVTCPKHHSLDLPYATSVSSSPDSANTPGSRSSLSTFSILSIRCSEAPSIASELGSDINKEKEKGKGKESVIEAITIPEPAHIASKQGARSITGSSDYEEFHEVVPAERKQPTLPVASNSPNHNQAGDSDNIPTNTIQRATQTVDNTYPANTARERDGGKAVAFVLPNEHAGGLRHGNQGPTTMTSSGLDSLSYGYRGDPTKRTSYKWLMLVSLKMHCTVGQNSRARSNVDVDLSYHIKSSDLFCKRHTHRLRSFYSHPKFSIQKAHLSPPYFLPNNSANIHK